ncbi:MAG TPA: methyltransferase domain-containing protein [Pirellulales bacterium]|nr:methyltransferase domain-containing protein [Pirellulales bacterium]
MSTINPLADAETSVYERYAEAAQRVEPALCCPIEYNTDYLAAIPPEILERDYGCGDPTPYVRPGDTVLDLGSGGGKVCYIAAQMVGPHGRVIGVDCNDEMLSLARRHQATVADRLGYDVVEFRRGLIQDLQLDLDLLANELARQPVDTPARWLELRAIENRLRAERPLIASETIDCVVSNCVLNLVRPADRVQLLAEVFRVLKPGGRAAISDIVADEDVPERLQHDPQLWSGCISGAFREDRFLAAFEAAGFHGIQMAKYGREPWRTVEGIEFRSMTVVAYKGKQGPCLEANQAVIYRGPFKQVEDDDGHVYSRGQRTAVCDKTFRLLAREPYAGLFEPIEPRATVPLASAQPFDCNRSSLRHPRETKATGNSLPIVQDDCCGTSAECC